MKEENENYLKNYEQDMLTALYHNYSRPVSSEVLMRIEAILKEEDVRMPKINYSCSRCVLRLIRTAGGFYFKTFPDRVPEKLRDRKI